MNGSRQVMQSKLFQSHTIQTVRQTTCKQEEQGTGKCTTTQSIFPMQNKQCFKEQQTVVHFQVSQLEYWQLDNIISS